MAIELSNETLAEGGFQVIVPALPGTVTYGRTVEKARELAQDAIACHLQGLLKDNEDIPDDPFAAEDPIIEELKIAGWLPRMSPKFANPKPKVGFYIPTNPAILDSMKH